MNFGHRSGRKYAQNFRQPAVMWARLLPWITHSCPTLSLTLVFNADATRFHSLSPHAHPNVTMLQGTCIWMYVAHKDEAAQGEEGQQWKERRTKTQGERSEGEN